MSFIRHVGFFAFLTLLLTSSIAAVSADLKQDPVRQLSDTVAEQIKVSNTNAIYEEFSPKLKTAYSRDELLSPVKKIQSSFGNIIDSSFSAAQGGMRQVSNEWIKTVIFWYRVKTDRYPDGYYLKVEITYAENKFYLAGYSMVKFYGSVPDFLK